MQNPRCLLCFFYNFVLFFCFHSFYVLYAYMYTLYCYCLLRLFCFVFFYKDFTHIPLPDFPWEPGFWSFDVKDCEKEIQRKYEENISGCRRLWKGNPIERWSANTRIWKMYQMNWISFNMLYFQVKTVLAKNRQRIIIFNLLQESGNQL